MTDSELFLGIDLGTSGCRCIAVDAKARPVASFAASLPPPLREGARCEQDPQLWRTAVLEVVRGVVRQIALAGSGSARIQTIAVDGTSATTLLVDAAGTPLGSALMYNDSQSRAEAKIIAEIAPPNSAAHGASSSLAKAMRLYRQHSNASGECKVRYVLHQADWVSGLLSARFGVSDENNALKLGYDPLQRRWPAWLADLDIPTKVLPDVVPPGTIIGPIQSELAHLAGLPPEVQIVAGTTDSTAAVLATGARDVGDAVTSLGSTLVLKVLSETPVFAPQYGVYSHRLGDMWLTGGASNSGGAILLRYFTPEQLERMTTKLRPNDPTGLNYYPLPAPGERFPVNDPDFAPRIIPRPYDDIAFFQGMLEGIGAIEHQGYRLLHALGAPYPKSVRSVGGGAINPAWTAIRGRLLGLPMTMAAHTQAAYGAAVLARQARISHHRS